MAAEFMKSRRESASYFWYMEHELGHGATGNVYKCQDKKTGKEFAAKVFNVHGMNRPEDVTGRELNVLRKLKNCTHENIVRVIEIEEEMNFDTYVIIMEYCSGGSLHSMLDKPENAFGFDENDFKQVAFDVVSGMKYLNDNSMIHRDIKPGNILRYIKDDYSSVYKLTDFGAARELAPEQEFMSIYGTEEYLHPDMFERGVLKFSSKDKKFTANVDLWSLGATFYHVATGKLPFRPYEGRVDRQKMFEITSKKGPGDISGIQKEKDGPIEWSNKLPEHSRLSQGLKEHLLKILPRLLETDPNKGMKFDELFQAMEKIKAMKVIHVYSVHSGTIHLIYANPEDNFARFQELVAIQTGVSARQQDLFYNNYTFKPCSMATVSTYPNTTEQRPILVLGGDSIPSEKISAQVDLKKPRFHTSTNIELLESDAAISKVAASNIQWCLHNVKNVDVSTNLTLEAAQNVMTLLKRKARKYLDDAKAIENHCQSIVMKHQACLNGCNFQVEVMQTIGNDEDIPKEIVAELDTLIKETDSFKKNMEKLQGEMVAPLEKLRTTAQTLLSDGELAKKWENMNIDDKPEKYVAKIKMYTEKVEEITGRIQWRKKHRYNITREHLEQHKFDRFHLEEYFTKAKDAMDACQNRRQKLHENLQKWLEEVFTCRSNLKQMRKEVESFIDMFNALASSEEKWRADHMTRMKSVVSKARHQVRRAISTQSSTSDQQSSSEDARNDGDVVQLGSDFIDDINDKLQVLTTETKEAKSQLKKGSETFQKFVEDLIEGLSEKTREMQNEQQIDPTRAS
ncbi:serine/threonine-protein kinase TBK1-like [Dendronephthya gigantea]|uniref:serine/threonine-protein kinase TBK1-like n=1 Tax=Dendronephthya gigantea TaxID=151771 RepID=UPI0010699CD0|nr:serine/threonine-protein kinase TBK1-like [Dendronephthya gigantea]